MPTIIEKILKKTGKSEKELMSNLVVDLYQKDELTFGEAAEMLQMTVMEFRNLLQNKGLNEQEDVFNFFQDVENIKNYQSK